VIEHRRARASIAGALVHGVDVVDVERIERMLADHPERFPARVFTDRERRDVLAHGRAAERYAARFAAKEAVLKALGCGWSGGVAWTDVEIRRDDLGRPSVHLAGEAARIARRLGIGAWLVSLSHSRRTAFASVIGLADPGAPVAD